MSRWNRVVELETHDELVRSRLLELRSGSYERARLSPALHAHPTDVQYFFLSNTIPAILYQVDTETSWCSSRHVTVPFEGCQNCVTGCNLGVAESMVFKF